MTIWKSRKLWISIVDVVVSLAVYFIGKYSNPESAKDILFLIATVQPVILAVIVSITVQNVAGINAESFKDLP